jgi:hypothetical protein
LRKATILVREEHDAKAAGHEIENFIRKSQFFGIHYTHTRLESTTCRFLAGRMGHRFGEINSDYFPACTNALRKREKHRAPTRGNVKHARTGINARNIHEPSAKMSEASCP